MSAIRRLSAVYRREQRQIRACPYHRSEESLQKEKKASRVRQPSFFSSYLPLIPSQWSSYLGYFNIFNIFGSSKESKKKEKEKVNVVVIPEEDVVMTDSEGTTTTTEESSSDSSVEIIEVLEAVEPVAPVAPMKPSVPTMPMRNAGSVVPVVRPTIASSSREFISSTLSRPSPQPDESACGVPSSVSTTEPLVFRSDDDVLAWAKQKVDRGEELTSQEVLSFKTFLNSTRRGELPFQPIKLRFARESSLLPKRKAARPGAVPCGQPTSVESTYLPPSSDGVPDSSAACPSYISGFHSSNGLPTFKNNVPSRRRRVLKSHPYKPIEWRGIGSVRDAPEESGKREARVPLPRLDPYKRRRLFDKGVNPISSDGTRSTPAPSDASNSGPYAPPRSPRTGDSRQHAAPHSPSPLRNVLNGLSPPSPRQMSTMPTNLNASSSKGTRSTYSATLVQEIVEKAPSRPRYSDVANPYQTVIPVKPLTRPMEKKKMSERKARTKELEKQREAARVKGVEKKKELTAKEIIEATVPKGAKRSRPPPGLTKSKAIDTSVSVVSIKRSLEEPWEQESITKKRRCVTVEEVSDDDDGGNRPVPARPNVIIESRSPSPEPAPCPARPCVGGSPPMDPSGQELPIKGASSPGLTIKEQVTNVVRVKDSIPKMASTKEMSSKAPSSKEPSLKVSAVKESTAKTSATRVSSTKGLGNHFSSLLNAKATGKSSVPREPSKLRTSFLPDDYENEEPKVASPAPAPTVVMTTPGTPLADIQEKKDPKEVALTLPLNDLPSFIFKTPPTLTAGDHMDARVAAKELPVNSLPKFDFSKARTSLNGMYLPAVPIPTIKPFDFDAAGVKPSASSNDGQWQCPTCMLQNSAAAVEKCFVCDSPRPDAEEPRKLAVYGVSGVTGTNGTNGARGKGTPSKPPVNSSAVKVFDFAAAGFKPKGLATDAQWTWICPTCMLQNPPTAVEKCSVCDSARPEANNAEKSKKPYTNGTAHPPSKPTNGVSTPVTKSFDFAAAGVKPPAPASNGNWQCPTCMLQNPATASEKCKICDSPRPGVEVKPVCRSAVPVKPSAPVVSKSFDWAAAGMIPRMNSNSWTCGTCMLSNPPTATEKCRICDASRS